MMIVAVTLLSILALLCFLAWGLIRMAIKSKGKLIIESKAAAILFRIHFHVEYQPSDDSKTIALSKRVESDKALIKPTGEIQPIRDPGYRIGGDASPKE